MKRVKQLWPTTKAVAAALYCWKTGEVETETRCALYVNRTGVDDPLPEWALEIGRERYPRPSAYAGTTTVHRAQTYAECMAKAKDLIDQAKTNWRAQRAAKEVADGEAV